jgi:hypothetical protein
MQEAFARWRGAQVENGVHCVPDAADSSAHDFLCAPTLKILRIESATILYLIEI